MRTIAALSLCLSIAFFSTAVSAPLLDKEQRVALMLYSESSRNRAEAPVLAFPAAPASVAYFYDDPQNGLPGGPVAPPSAGSGFGLRFWVPAAARSSTTICALD